MELMIELHCKKCNHGGRAYKMYEEKNVMIWVGCRICRENNRFEIIHKPGYGIQERFTSGQQKILIHLLP